VTDPLPDRHAPPRPDKEVVDLRSWSSLLDSSYAGYRVVETHDKRLRVEIDIPGYSKEQMEIDFGPERNNNAQVLGVEKIKSGVKITVNAGRIVYPEELELDEAPTPNTSFITIAKPVCCARMEEPCYKNGLVVLTFPLEN